MQTEREPGIADLAGNAGGVQLREPVGGRRLAELRAKQVRKCRVVRGARRLSGEAGIRGEGWRPDRNTETIPVLLGRRDDAQPPVGRLV